LTPILLIDIIKVFRFTSS